LPKVQALYAQAGQALRPALGEIQGLAKPEAREQRAQPDQPAARVLCLCTHNGARSQMAEAILRHLRKGEVDAFSAGTEPTELHSMAVEAMDKRGISSRGQRSKHLSQFLGQDFDYIITVCDVAGEACPVFPGDPKQIHWSLPDPGAVEGTEARRRAFQTTATELTTRINYLLRRINAQQREKRRKAGAAAVGD
jgi:ArsR family transcriptional regulator, arsenate/arsenite/antimonite-responsive transcriptional repressor / arsenate reductase (thioredoxin)